MVYDPLAGTDMAMLETPETMTGFGVAEVAALIALHDGPSSSMTREIFGLDPNFADDSIMLAGASSLTARGMLTTTEAGFQALSSAALLEVVMAQALRWIRVGLLTQDDPRVAFILQSPTVTALIEPSATVTYWAAFSDPDGDTAQMLTLLIEDRLSGQPASAAVVDLRGLEGPQGNLMIRRTPLGLVSVLADVNAEGEGGREVPIGDGGLRGILADRVAPLASSES